MQLLLPQRRFFARLPEPRAPAHSKLPVRRELCPSPSCPGDTSQTGNCCLRVWDCAEGDPAAAKTTLPSVGWLECRLLMGRHQAPGARWFFSGPSQQSSGGKFNFIADEVGEIAPLLSTLSCSGKKACIHPVFGRHMRLSSGSGFAVTHRCIVTQRLAWITTAATVTGRPQLRVQLND
ncbi:serine protease HTRA3-like protein, partial [Lates japonicus]